MSTSKLTHLAIFLLLATTSCLADEPIECKEVATPITSDEGFLSITKNQESCEFKAGSNNKFFVIQTDDLKLNVGDTIKVSSDDAGDNDVYINGPQEDGFIVSGALNSKIVFTFKNKNNTTMLVKFYQRSNDSIGKSPIPIVADRNKALLFRNIHVKQNYPVVIQKLVEGPVYIQESHSLIEKDQDQLDLPKEDFARLTVSPVMLSCSGSHESKTEETIEITGPNNESLKDVTSYKCVKIFRNTMGGRAHYDIGFENFMELVDKTDTLTVTDGIQTLEISQSNSQEYREMKPYISFSGPILVIVYDSPVVKTRLDIQFKLSIYARSIGGIVDSYGYKFDIPNKGSAFYSLRLPAGKQESVALEFSKLTGVELTITNRQNKVIKLKGPNFPDLVVFNDVNVNIEIASTTKVSGSIIYQTGDDCGGTLFDPPVDINFSKVNKTCHWLLGGQSNKLAINFNGGPGAFEIYNPESSKPVLSKNNIVPTEILPQINIDGPAYLIVHSSSNPDSSFGASVLPRNKLSVSSQTDSQVVMTSAGYPTSYFWSDESESLQFDAKNKEVVLSVADLDLREGEKLISNSTHVANAPVDFIFKNQTIPIKVQRTGANDLNLHRGYKIITTEFQTISFADMTKSTLTTPRNLTSYLLRISGVQGKRILYDITPSSSDTNYVMQVIDSASILGRSVEAAEKLNGSSTSNVLLMSVRSSKDKVFLPTFAINYSQVACNQTTDHICDDSTRCVPAEKMCKGVSYCADGSDLKVPCSSGPAPAPNVIESGVSGVAVFFVSMLMFTIGVITALYGPDLYKNFEARFRSGHYTTFQSAE